MLVVFSDQENPLEFEPLSTNTAGSLRLSSGSSIIGGLKARQEILILTDAGVDNYDVVFPDTNCGSSNMLKPVALPHLNVG